MNAPRPIARLAKGKRAVFGAGGPEVNQLLAAVASLASEVSVLRQRVRTLEHLGNEDGWLKAGEVDAHEPSIAEREDQARWNEQFLSRVFYLAVEPAPGEPPLAPPPGMGGPPPGASPPGAPLSGRP